MERLIHYGMPRGLARPAKASGTPCQRAWHAVPQNEPRTGPSTCFRQPSTNTLAQNNDPLFATVESDIVGYTTIELGQGSHLISIPFEALDGADATFPIQSITGTFNSGLLSGDKLLVWDPDNSSYAMYRWTGDSTGWVKGSESTPTTDVVRPNQGIFFSSMRGGATMTVAGKISSEGSQTVTLAQGTTFLANPYPCDLPIATLQGSFTAGLLSGDKILRWDSVEKKYISYIYTTNGWCRTSESTATTDSIPSGEVFVFSRMKAGTSSITFTSPLNN